MREGCESVNRGGGEPLAVVADGPATRPPGPSVEAVGHRRVFQAELVIVLVMDLAGVVQRAPKVHSVDITPVQPEDFLDGTCLSPASLYFGADGSAR